MAELKHHRGGFVFEKLPRAVYVEVAKAHYGAVALFHPLVCQVVHRQFAEAVDVRRIFTAHGLWCRCVAVCGAGAGVDHRGVHPLCHLQKIFESVQVRIYHDLLVIHRRVADGRFVKYVVEAEIFEPFEILSFRDVSGYYLAPEAFEVLVVSEAFQVAVVESLARTEEIENDHLRLRIVLLEPVGEVGADEACATGYEYAFAVKVHAVPLYRFFCFSP